MIELVLAGLGVVAAFLGYWAGYAAGEAKGYLNGFDDCMQLDEALKEIERGANKKRLPSEE